MNQNEIEAELKRRGLEMCKHDDEKAWGACDVCGYETVLVAQAGMCGPCTFGEADTINGNW